MKFEQRRISHSERRLGPDSRLRLARDRVGCAWRWLRTVSLIAIGIWLVYVLIRLAQPRPELLDVQTVCVDGQIYSISVADQVVVVGMRLSRPAGDRHDALRIYERGPDEQLVARGELLLGHEISRIATDGEFAYLIARGLHVVDIRDIDQPALVKSLDWAMPLQRSDGSTVQIRLSQDHAGGVALADDLLLVQVPGRGLGVVDVSSPEEAQLLAWHRIPRSEGAQGVAIRGTYAYVAEGGLRVIDFSTPSSPREVALIEGTWYQSRSQALVVDEQRGLLYLVATYLHVFDIEQPELPRHVGWADSASIWKVGLREALFVADSYDDIALTSDSILARVPGGMFTKSYGVVLDRRQPLRPVRVGGSLDVDLVADIGATGDRIILASLGFELDPDCQGQLLSAELHIGDVWR